MSTYTLNVAKVGWEGSGCMIKIPIVETRKITFLLNKLLSLFSCWNSLYIFETNNGLSLILWVGITHTFPSSQSVIEELQFYCFRHTFYSPL
jgi:hypothetical protein